MITSLYAGLLAILFFRMSTDVIRQRVKHKVSLGYGPNNEIEGVVSAHNNFASYTVLTLFLLYLLEQSQVVPGAVIHVLAAVFTLGRVLHYKALSAEEMKFKLRRAGMMMTFFPLVFLGAANIYAFARSLIS